jgi:hypothetical protein
MVTARNGLDPSDPHLLLRLGNALKRMDAVSAHIVISALALPRATRILRTRVHAQVAGDTWFPTLAATDWRVTASERFMPDARNAHAMTFETLERISVA